MPSGKGFHLHVNLGAAQVRRRLKGHGFGVRRVEAAGKGRAVIVHTATGVHLRQLEALFEDVLARPAEPETDVSEPSVRVEDLLNIDAISAAWLRDVGVATRADLEHFGPVFAYSLVRERQPECSLNLLWALAGALADVDWRDLPPEEREQLRQAVGE
jgi:hypothetical protein